MRNLLKSLTVVTALTLAATSALASDGAYNKSVSAGKTERAAASYSAGKSYLKGLVGYNFGQQGKVTGLGSFDGKYKAKSSMTFGFGAGYEVVENLRTELMLNFVPSKDYKLNGETLAGKLSLFNPMLNAHYDFGNMSGVTPFLSAGLGLSTLHGDNFRSEARFSYMAGAGLGFEVTKDVVAELSYAYTHYGTWKNKYVTTQQVKVTGSSVNVAVRFKL